VDAGTDRYGSSPRRSRRSFRRARDQRGAIAVEFALIVPLLLMLVLGIIEFGFGYHAWDATQNAAREGARLGAVLGTDSNKEQLIIDRVEETMSFLDEDNWTISVQCKPAGGVFTSCGSWAEGEIIRVTVDYGYDFITPLPNFVGMGSQMSMRSIAEARFEGA
jgi:hypothetical protein